MANKYYEMFNYEQGKFFIQGINNEKRKENKEDISNINNNTDNLLDKEESNPEEIKIKQEFFKNIVNDFKKMFIYYLENFLKK